MSNRIDVFKAKGNDLENSLVGRLIKLDEKEINTIRRKYGHIAGYSGISAFYIQLSKEDVPTCVRKKYGSSFIVPLGEYIPIHEGDKVYFPDAADPVIAF